jgi:hypothetical protein
LKPTGNVPKPSFKKTSGYVILPFCQYLFSIELERSNLKSASNLALSYFPRGFHWIYEHPLKTLSFYSNILTQTKSVQIGPIFDNKDPTKIIFHRIKFFKVISEKEWGGHPSSERELKGKFGVHYNYYDYIKAWSKVFLYQTALMDHSWFIPFDKNFTRVLPIWFAHWWSHYGLIPDVIPLNFVGTFDLFRSCFKVDAYGHNFPLIFHFAKMFKISWIIKWQYVIVENRVERHWFCKWWDKFPIDPIIEEVGRMAQAPKAQNVPLPSTISPKLIGNTPNKALTATSPASSSTSMSKKERKKALLNVMIALEKEEDSDEEDSASSAPIYDPQRDFFGNSGFGSNDDVLGLEDL